MDMRFITIFLLLMSTCRVRTNWRNSHWKESQSLSTGTAFVSFRNNQSVFAFCGDFREFKSTKDL